jgi:hypothetical protein
MLFLGLPSLSEVWTGLWQVARPETAQLTSALSVTWAVSAPAKGALFVLAVCALLSKTPFTRAALYGSMALVPPLNIAFPFRQQGFLLGPVTVATVLSIILWGSFLLIRESAPQPATGESRSSHAVGSSRWDTIRLLWLAANSTALTLLAALFLFGGRTALGLLLPCLSASFAADGGGVPSLVHTTMASGTHVLALATASWFATANARSHPDLGWLIMLASTVHAGLFMLFPIRQIVQAFGTECASGSLLIVSVPLFAAWVIVLIAEISRSVPLVASPKR